MSSYTKSKCTKLALKRKMENGALTDFEQLRGSVALVIFFLKNKN